MQQRIDDPTPIFVPNGIVIPCWNHHPPSSNGNNTQSSPDSYLENLDAVQEEVVGNYTFYDRAFCFESILGATPVERCYHRKAQPECEILLANIRLCRLPK